MLYHFQLFYAALLFLMYTNVSWPGVYLSFRIDFLLHGVYDLGGI
jgi:hypothetical protein